MTTAVARERYRVGPLLLDVDARLVSRDGELVVLPPKTFELFVELVRRAPGVVRRQELIDTVWPHEFVNDEALTQRVMLLRRALGDDPKDPQFIASAPRWGYRLVAPVHAIGDERPPVEAAAPEEPPHAGSGSSERLRVVAAGLRRRLHLVVWVLVAVVAAASAGLAHLVLARRHAIDSVAVLPFTGPGGDADTEYVAEGMSEAARASLTRLPGIRVPAGSAVEGFRGRTVNPREAGHELGVRAVLAGSVVQRGDRLTVHLKLVDVRDGDELWSGRFERASGDLLAVQSELTRELTARLRPGLADVEKARLSAGATASALAYRAYLQGRYCWNRRSEDGFRKAIAFFSEATTRDPAYAVAYAGLADCYALLGSAEYGAVAPLEAEREAREAALRALEIDDSLAEAHATLGLILWSFDWEWRRGEAELRRAIELDPRNVSAHQWYAELLAAEGRFEAAREGITRAQECEPTSLVVGAETGMIAYYARDWDGAGAAFRRTLDMEPTFVQALLGLGLTESQAGRHDEALATLARAVEMSGRAAPAVAAFGYACGRAGRREEALRALAELAAPNRFASAYYVAGVQLGLGDDESALASLKKACEEHSTLLVALGVEPAVDRLRGDPRFPGLLHRVGLR